MPDTVMVLGANGRFGRAACEAFLTAGWRVRCFARSGAAGSSAVEWIVGDAFDARALADAARGSGVIVNALNPPYSQWRRDLPRLTANVIGAAKSSGATVIIPGNVYHYGAQMPARLAENTPTAPTTRKGRLRAEMERAYADAEGVRTIILRAGDFIERQKTGNWFDSYIATDVAKGRVMYPGPLDRLHAWAYLPDMASAMAVLAEKRADLDRFEEFGFAGYALTGRMLVDAMARSAGRKLKVKGFFWTMVRLLGLAWPQMREVAEMSYLWRRPHAIDGAKLAALLPEFWETPYEAAIAEALA
ncbi:MAG TPA: NAD-dependent epimerase/dehydratase family protein [Alphaproteobacteria bacterium]|nr:NAD-dependent epimerase/dehydratase family protein [Alphaproteobacteria bacterium]